MMNTTQQLHDLGQSLWLDNINRGLLTRGSIHVVEQPHEHAQRSNLFIKIPGTAAGIPAIEEAIFAGALVNVTLKLLAKSKFLKAGAASIMRDQKILPVDAELLRAFSGVLDCPMPPIVP